MMTYAECPPEAVDTDSTTFLGSPLLKPVPDWPEGLDFEIRERYALAARLAARLCAGTTGPVRFLEVGCHVLHLLPKLFQPDLVHVTRCDVFPEIADDPNYVRIVPGEPLPFRTRGFDVVIGLEVLEHIAPTERGRFLAECLRVSDRGFILSCPNGRPETIRCEAMLAAAYLRRNGKPHPFLAEHEEFGLPVESAVRGLLDRLEVPYAVFGQCPLDLWLSSRLLMEPLVENRAESELIRRLEEVLVLLQRRSGANSILRRIPYRKFYVAARSFDATTALEPLPKSIEASIVDLRTEPPIGDGSADDPGEMVLHLAKLSELLLGISAILPTANPAPAVKRSPEEKYVAEALHQRLRLREELMQQLHKTLLARLTAPLRVLGRKLLPCRVPIEQLIPWRDLRLLAVRPDEPLPEPNPEPIRDRIGTGRMPDLQCRPALPIAENTWESVGGDPQLIVAGLIPAGWFRLRLHIEGRGSGTTELYADFGDGFTPQSCLESMDWVDELHIDTVIHAPKPILAFRLDPLKTFGTFRIKRFEIISIPTPTAWVGALRTKMRLLSSYGCTLPALGRGLKHLLRGDLRTLRTKLFKAFHDDRLLGPEVGRERRSYDAWRRAHALSDAERTRQRDESAAWENAPRISVLLPVYNPPIDFLAKAIESVLRQTYPHWQLCLVDDGSTDRAVLPLLRHYADRDSRITLITPGRNQGIAGASNAALAAAQGEFIALLDHDDELAEHALFRVAEAIRANPQVEFLYSDEDKLELDGRHVDPFFKPDWSPEYFLTCMYTCHLGVYRTKTARAVGGFRSAFDFAQDYDLALRMVRHIQNESRTPSGTSTESQRIHHIPDVLYHWRKLAGSTAVGHAAKPQADDAARRAVQSYLDAQGRGGWVEAGPSKGLHRVRYPLHGRPKVSIVIPSAGKEVEIGERKTWFVVHCIESIRRKTTYDNYEILVIDNDDMVPLLQRRLDSLGVIRIPFTEEFNLSKKMNRGVAEASGAYVLLLNDDMEIITPDWIESLLEWGQWPEIGAVGAKLLFGDGSIQHAGVTLLQGKLPSHHFYRMTGDHPGYWASNLLTRNWTAVTGACLLTRTTTYQSVGGFDPAFPLNFNDIDFCMKLGRRGLRIVGQPWAQLYHFESVSKAGCFQHEIDAFVAKWGNEFPFDPMYSPHLTQTDGDFRIGPVGRKSCPGGDPPAAGGKEFPKKRIFSQFSA